MIISYIMFQYKYKVDPQAELLDYRLNMCVSD